MGGELRTRGIVFSGRAIQSWWIDVAGAGKDELLDSRLSGRSSQALGTYEVHFTSLLGGSATEERGEVHHGFHPLQSQVERLSPDQIPLYDLRSLVPEFLNIRPRTDEGPDLIPCR
jgi:hypothetical protein